MKINVQILSHTENPEKTVAQAAKLCYSPSSIENLKEKIEKDDVGKFIRKLLSMRHLSAFEHASFTFGIDGISRVTTHELVRHRIASYSQQSQRYIEEKNMFEYKIPPSVEKNDDLKKIYREFMEKSFETYNYFVASGVAKEDARFVLPNAKEAKIIVSMNARELRHFFNLRMCTRAQWEIREMASKMCELVNEIAPNIFYSAGATCDELGYCPEGDFSCGRKPVR